MAGCVRSTAAVRRLRKCAFEGEKDTSGKEGENSKGPLARLITLKQERGRCNAQRQGSSCDVRAGLPWLLFHAYVIRNRRGNRTLDRNIYGLSRAGRELKRQVAEEKRERVCLLANWSGRELLPLLFGMLGWNSDKE